MSNLVQQINEALESSIAAVLGSEWEILDYRIDIEKQDLRNKNKKYGVRPGALEPVATRNREYTIKQTFEVILLKSFIDRANTGENKDLNTLQIYTEMDDITKEIFLRKAGLPNVIILIGAPSMEAPEYLPQAVVLRGKFPITYRKSID